MLVLVLGDDDLIDIQVDDGRIILVNEETNFYKIIKENNLDNGRPVVLCSYNGIVHELGDIPTENGKLEVINISSKIGMRCYEKTLQYVLIKAVFDLFKDAKITIEHTLGSGLFGEIHKETPLTAKETKIIKDKMKEIINKDLPIKKVKVSKQKAIDIFSEYGMADKIRLLKHVENDELKLYELDGRFDYFYGTMAYSTGVLTAFDLIYYEPGFILNLPSNEEPFIVPEFKEQRKLSKIFYETEQWGNILDVGDVGSLNDKVEGNQIFDIIRISEALHEKKIAYIADMIHSKKELKLVLIAGPSSSGKTTFARRLGIQLRVNGLMPVPISLDDYFVDREHTPRDEKGNYDFESIYALDLKLFNENLTDLMKGSEVEIPAFNFKLGKREWKDEKVKLPPNGVIVIEGIHGLNELLTAAIPKENKFKIYISALTQLNLDDHNRISTTDVRMIRRIVRDYLSRGYGSEDTLKMWPSIRRGEEKNIFVYQEEADAMFNSTLVYELCVLKKYALEELGKINETSEVYYEALRLKSFLNFFKAVDMNQVPDNSILREFVGGSCFYKY